MKDLYDNEYGIYNHRNVNNKRPLSSVAIHPGEDINSDSLLEEAIRTYVERGIGDIYKLSLLEYLDLPIDLINLISDIGGEKTAKNVQTMSQIESQFKT